MSRRLLRQRRKTPVQTPRSQSRAQQANKMGPPPAQITTAGQHQLFRFLELPAEIRNTIYECLFEGSTTTIRPLCDLKHHFWTLEHQPAGSKVPDQRRGLPAALAVNKQLRTEAIGIFYTRTKWISHEYDDLIALVRALGPGKVAEKSAAKGLAKVEKIFLLIHHDFSLLRATGNEVDEKLLDGARKFSMKIVQKLLKNERLVVRYDLLVVEVVDLDHAGMGLTQ